MKKVIFFIFIVCITALLATGASAAQNVVYVQDGGTGNGATAENPIGSLTKAYSALGEEGGTVVLCGECKISARTAMPAHTSAVTLTSAYGGTDYRTKGAAIRFTTVATLWLGGPTEIDSLHIILDPAASAGCVLSANFHPLTIGRDVIIEDLYAGSGTNSGLYLVAGATNPAARLLQANPRFPSIAGSINKSARSAVPFPTFRTQERCAFIWVEPHRRRRSISAPSPPAQKGATPYS